MNTFDPADQARSVQGECGIGPAECRVGGGRLNWVLEDAEAHRAGCQARRARARRRPGGRAARAAGEAVRSVGGAMVWRERRWIDDLQLQICRIPAPTFFEQRRAEWVRRALAGVGWEARIDRAGNVIGPTSRCAGRRAAGGPHGASGYSSGAAIGRGYPRRRARAADRSGRFRQRGRTGRFVRHGPRYSASSGHSAIPAGGLLLVANVGEEGEGNLSGMRYLCRQSHLAPRIRSFLVLDGPSTDHFTAEALACRRYEIVISGPGGHSWSDFGTANPVHALSRAIASFADVHAPRAAAGERGGSPSTSESSMGARR